MKKISTTMWIIEQKNSYRVGFTVIIVIVDKRLTNNIFLWTNIFYVVDKSINPIYQKTYPLMSTMTVILLVSDMAYRRGAADGLSGILSGYTAQVCGLQPQQSYQSEGCS